MFINTARWRHLPST